MERFLINDKYCDVVLSHIGRVPNVSGQLVVNGVMATDIMGMNRKELCHSCWEKALSEEQRMRLSAPTFNARDNIYWKAKVLEALDTGVGCGSYDATSECIS
jgi:hypothetical protein